MKVRSVTYFAPLSYPFQAEDITTAGRFLRSARQTLGEAGLETQTLRLATPPFTQVLGDPEARQVVAMAQALESACAGQGIDFVSIGPVQADRPDALLTPIFRLPETLSQTETVFATVSLASAGQGINLAAVQASAEVICQVSQNTPQGFGTLRFAALANCPPGSPFFPAAYHDGGPPRFAFATQAADLVVDAFSRAGSLEEARRALIEAFESAAGQLSQVAQRLVEEHGVEFGGIDFSLAPYPGQETSIGAAIEQLGIDRFGGPGTLFAAAFIMNCLRQVRFPRCGYSGLMFPVLEDSVLAARTDDGLYGIDSLLLYSTVCGAGLDTIPLPGEVEVEELAGILLDMATLAITLDKPLSARLMPVPGLASGQRTAFDFEYFANARGLPIKSSGVGQLLRQNRFVPWPSGVKARERRR
ncbi:MAG: PFL family protein [Anaerolineae bacterium]